LLAHVLNIPSKVGLLLLIFTLSTSICSYSQIVDAPKSASGDSSAVLPMPGSEAADTTGPLLVIGDVKVEGNNKTKLYIIQREIPFKEGDYLLRSNLQKKLVLCKQQLMNTSLFVDVDVSIEKEEKELVFINIRVKERWYLFPLPYFKIVDRNFNEWWVQNKRSLQRINYGLKFMQNNVSGRNDKLNIWLISGYTTQASLRYENPFIDKNLKHGINLGFGYSTNHELNYALDYNKQKFLTDPNQFLVSSLFVDLGYSYRPAIKTRHNFRLSYFDYKVKDTVLKRNPFYLPTDLTRVRYPELGYSIEYYNVDYNAYPLKGILADGYVNKRFGSKTGFWQIGGSGAYHFKIAPKSYVQLQAIGLMRFPYRQSYFANSMFGSSSFYMRGLEYYVTEGAVGGIGRVTAKKEALSFNIPNPIRSETHDKIPIRIFVKAYSDIGYSYEPRNNNYYTDDKGNVRFVYSFLNNKLLRTWGAGVDLVTFYDLVLKFEYSFNQFGESGFFFHTRADF
jgi:outer membrane protein assembly factor BamA